MHSKNLDAERIMGLRRTDGVALDQPCELNFRCPICGSGRNKEREGDAQYNLDLTWSEYNGFLYCYRCDLDIPSVLCIPDLYLLNGKPKKDWEYSGLKDAIKMFLDIIERCKNDSKSC